MERTLFLHTIQRQRQSDSEGVRVTVTVSEIERERERVGQRLRQRNMKLGESGSIESFRSHRYCKRSTLVEQERDRDRGIERESERECELIVHVCT